MVFSFHFFRRLLANITPGVAFYPIVFSQYDPAHVGEFFDNFEIQEMSGLWRKYGYGMIAIHKSDFEKTGGFDVKIEGYYFAPIFGVMALLNQFRIYDARVQNHILIFRLGLGRCVLGK